MDIGAIRKEIETDLSFFLEQYRFLTQVSSELKDKIKLVSKSSVIEPQLRSYLEELKNKLGRVNESLVQIQNRTQQIEQTIDIDLKTNSGHKELRDIKEYTKSLTSMQKHLRKGVEVQVMIDFTALQSLLEALRLATESKTIAHLVEESTNVQKIVRRITLYFAWQIS